jgi:hypothetical protein
MVLSDNEKQELDNNLTRIIEGNYARSSAGIWYYIEEIIPTVDHQKDGFLYVLEQLLRQGRVKMGRGHQLLNMSIEEVIQSFRDNWPSDEEFYDPLFSLVKPYKVPHKKNLQTHYWTPGDLVWIDPDDGHELWSTDAEAEPD